MIKQDPHPDLDFIIVIPAFSEKHLGDTLKSLLNCENDNIRVEIFVIVNDRIDSSKETKEINKNTIRDLDRISKENSNDRIRLYYSYQGDLDKKHGGVGLARKMGMDEALRRAYSIQSFGMPILCLDADCTVSSNYLMQIHTHFKQNPDSPGASIYFEHQLDNEAIVYYELFLRYYINALRFAGYPFAYHTVGSSMAVRALEYAMEGGMNRRKAGEDFYFIHKIIPRGQFSEINACTVYPSARKSERVPFGTGKAMIEFEKNSEKYLNFYDFQIFVNLKKVLTQIDEWYQCRNIQKSLELLYNALPEIFKSFIDLTEFLWQINEAKENSSSQKNFNKRIFQWLDAFTILKLIHFARDHYYPNSNALDIANRLLITTGISKNEISNVSDLLSELRKMDRKGTLLNQMRNI